jgi:hypothetical protein
VGEVPPVLLSRIFTDVVAAHPDARTMRCVVKPSVSAEFAAALRDFCTELASHRKAPLKRGFPLASL